MASQENSDDDVIYLCNWSMQKEIQVSKQLPSLEQVSSVLEKYSELEPRFNTIREKEKEIEEDLKYLRSVMPRRLSFQPTSTLNVSAHTSSNGITKENVMDNARTNTLSEQRSYSVPGVSSRSGVCCNVRRITETDNTANSNCDGRLL